MSCISCLSLDAPAEQAAAGARLAHNTRLVVGVHPAVAVAATTTAALEQARERSEEERDSGTKEHPHGRAIVGLEAGRVRVVLGHAVDCKVGDHGSERDDERENRDKAREEEAKLVGRPRDQHREERDAARDGHENVGLGRVTQRAVESHRAVGRNLRQHARKVVPERPRRALVLPRRLAHAPRAEAVDEVVGAHIQEADLVDDRGRDWTC